MVAEILFNHGARRHRNEEASLRDKPMVNTRSIRRALGRRQRVGSNDAGKRMSPLSLDAKNLSPRVTSK
jgi:hypothetical protein